MNFFERNLIFVSGKGGVGKTAVSKAIAETLAAQGHSTLWVCFEDPFRTPGAILKTGTLLSELNCEAGTAFEEYVTTKIGVPALTKIFLKNKVIQYLAKAAPGIHELVLLGKVWYERSHYDRVVVDMPSTGYGLAMFQSTENFSNLFKGGPIHKDSKLMLDFFADPNMTAQLIVALPEEMPLREGLELRNFLTNLFPKNEPRFFVNRCFPKVDTHKDTPAPDTWMTPVPTSVEDYLQKRGILEDFNLKILTESGVNYERLPFVVPKDGAPSVSHSLSQYLTQEGLLR